MTRNTRCVVGRSEAVGLGVRAARQDALRSWRRRRVRSGGVVMIIALLGLVLMSALVMNVINLGDQVGARLSTQHAADATAASGSTWVARSLNTVSMNNLAMAKYIALVPIMDSMPQAAEFTMREQKWLYESLERQLAAGTNGPGQHFQLATVVQNYFEQLREEMEEELEDLEPVVQEFQQIDGVEMTHYNAGSGRLWQAIQALDEINQGLMENLDLVAQMGAVSGGKANQANDPQAASMMLPLASDRPLVPFLRGEFNDFVRPVKHGLLPLDVDDPVVNRGGFDVLYGWREFDQILVGGTFVPGDVGGGQGRGSSLGGSNAGGSGGRTVGGEWERRAYRVWGPYEQMLRQISNYTMSRLKHTRLVAPYNHGFNFRRFRWPKLNGFGYLNRISDQKLNYIWPDNRFVPVNDPEWITEWQEAIQIADTEPWRIKETGFFYVEIRSKYPMNDSRFLSPGSWALSGNGENPGISIRRERSRQRWDNDPRRWVNNRAPGQFPRVVKINDHLWRDENVYMVDYDRAIGIDPIQNADGTYVRQPVYRVDHWAFAGINIGEPAEIINPFEGLNTGSPDAPAPMMLDHSVVTEDPASRYDYLTYLGVSRHSDQPQTWPSRFQGGRPYPFMVGVAQATVFNTHSWDLWTPMWHAQLEPVTDRSGESGLVDWVNRPGTRTPTGLTQQEVDQTLEYLRGAADMARDLMKH